MKNIFTTFMLLFVCSLTFAQFKLTGKITGGTIPNSVLINIPFVYGYYIENDIPIAVNSKGYFSTTIAGSQRFATINVNRKMFTLMMSPGKSLDIAINGPDTTIIAFKGSAAIQNRLVAGLGFEEAPFFNLDTAYSRLTLPQLKVQVLQKWFAMRNEKLNRLAQSNLSATDKKLIAQEIKANAITQLNDFARTRLETGRKVVSDLVLEIYKEAPLKPETLPAGPQYYAFTQSYIGYLETLAFNALPEGAINDPKTFVKYYNITIDSGNHIVKQKGKSFLNWMLVKNEFDKTVAEHWLAQAIESKYLTKDLSQLRPLMAEMEANYPHSSYLPAFRSKLNKLKQLLVINAANKEIQVAGGYEKMTSIYEVIKKLKGKVVYLDIWGTWCGPCKHELKFSPELKNYFKGKDVAYVYLDMDEDDKDGQWREFIQVNGMTGLHLRKNRKEIQSFWDELKPGNTTRYYPTYFIFDREGKLVLADAARPSEHVVLYKQIEKYL
jgi:thiol-disulfide isomerase/thioredoxin